MLKRLSSIALFFSLILNTFAQVEFEKGYLINNANQKVECLIKNLDWKKNPSEFTYILSEDASLAKGTIKDVKEFGIYGVSKYIRANVKIDISSENLDKMSSDRNPVFQETELFLKLLVEGKASLFLYEDHNVQRFFLQLNEGDLDQLIYKKYLSSNKIIINNDFRQQLFNELKCGEPAVKNIQNASYKRKDLERLVIGYNDCTNSPYKSYSPLQGKGFVHLTLRPGLNHSKLKLRNTISEPWDINFNQELGFRMGADFEYVFPFNKNKWAISVEPTYQSYKSEKETTRTGNSGASIHAYVNYSSIEIPIGLRHSFYLSNNSKIFTNLSLVFDLSNNATIDFSSGNGTENSLDIKSKGTFAFGAGYNFLGRYSIEARYLKGREILDNYAFFVSSYDTTSLIFGYKLF